MIEKIPRVFIGTMHCGEGDYVDCCTAIINQQNVDVHHVTIANMPEKEAHNRLWDQWRKVQHVGYDMFVKIDADTVLANDHVIAEIWKLFQSNTRITGIQAPLLDYFTDGSINGLNCFTPRVLFTDTNDPLFCDRVDVGHDVVIKADGVPNSLKPAGYHCFKSTDAQSFHFGLHRALKNQASLLELVRKAWLKHNDRQRAMALLGAQAATNFKNGEFNYADERFQVTLVATISRFDELSTQLI